MFQENNKPDERNRQHNEEKAQIRVSQLNFSRELDHRGVVNVRLERIRGDTINLDVGHVLHPTIGVQLV